MRHHLYRGGGMAPSLCMFYSGLRESHHPSQMRSLCLSTESVVCFGGGSRLGPLLGDELKGDPVDPLLRVLESIQHNESCF